MKPKQGDTKILRDYLEKEHTLTSWYRTSYHLLKIAAAALSALQDGRCPCNCKAAQTFATGVLRDMEALLK